MIPKTVELEWTEEEEEAFLNLEQTLKERGDGKCFYMGMFFDCNIESAIGDVNGKSIRYPGQDQANASVYSNVNPTR